MLAALISLRRPLLLVLALAATSTCSVERGHDRARRHRRRRASATSVDRRAAPEAAPAQAAPAVVPVGLSALPASPSDDLRAQNAAALANLKRGRIDAARESLTALAARAPEWDSAHYNLACASSRAGDTAAAAHELLPLLERDLPRYGRLLESDRDLAALRDSADIGALRAKIAALRPSWEHALEHGAPASIFEQREERSVITIRGGVWVPEWKRFVPMAPPVENRRQYPGQDSVAEAASLVDPRTRTVVTLLGETSLVDMGDIVAGVVVHRAVTGELLAEARRIDVPDPDAYTRNLQAHGIEDGVRFRCKGFREWHGWELLTSAGRRRDRSEELPTGPMVAMDREVVWIEPPPPPAGYGLHGKTLVTPTRAFELGPGHGREGEHFLLVAPDRSVAIVASIARTESMDGCVFRPSHSVVRVDLSTGLVSRLSDGPGWSMPMLGPDGALYLQVADRVRRYPSPRAAEFELLPEGIVLFPPPDC